MKWSKKLGLSLLSLVLAGSLSACGGGSSSSSGDSGQNQPAQESSKEAITIKLAHVGSETHQYHIAATKFKELLEQKSGGQLKVEVYPNGKLGTEKDAVEGVMNGTIDMTTVAADSSLANVIPEMNVFGIPYLFRDRDHVFKTLDGEIGKELLAKGDAHNMKGLGYWEIGFSHFTNSKKEIHKPEDMAGLKIRVQPAPIWEAFMKALGALPTPMSFTELYSAMEQGVVDGQENPIATIYSMKFYEVNKYLALTNHTYKAAAVIMSNKLWSKLSAEQQKWVEEAVQEAADYQRQYLADKEKESLEEMKGKGLVVTEPDLAAFAEVSKDVYKAVADKVPQDLIDRIKAVQ